MRRWVSFLETMLLSERLISRIFLSLIDFSFKKMIKNDRSCLWIPGTSWRVPGSGFYFSVMPRHRKSRIRDPGPIRGTWDLHLGPGMRDPVCGTLFKEQIRETKVRKPILIIRAQFFWIVLNLIYSLEFNSQFLIIAK